MTYYPESGNHIRDKDKATMLLKKLDHVTGVDTSDLAAKKHCIALKAEVDKLDMKKLANVRTSLNNLKTKVDDLDVGRLKKVRLENP